MTRLSRILLPALLSAGTLCPAQGISAEPALAQPPAAAEILAACAQKYQTCSSYQDEGVVVTRFEGASIHQESRKPFRTVFLRSGKFRYEFWEERPLAGELRYVVWQDGEAIKSWWTIGNKVVSHPNLGEAIAGPTGVSGSSAYTIPSCLLKDAAWKGGTWTEAKGAYRISDGQQDNSDCYRVQRLTAAPARKVQDMEMPATNGKVTYWIRKDSQLLVRIDGDTDFGSFRTQTTTTYAPVLDRPIAESAFAFQH